MRDQQGNKIELIKIDTRNNHFEIYSVGHTSAVKSIPGTWG